MADNNTTPTHYWAELSDAFHQGHDQLMDELCDRVFEHAYFGLFNEAVRRGFDEDAAHDRVQQFYLEVRERRKDIIGRYRRPNGKFRAYFLKSFYNFLKTPPRAAERLVLNASRFHMLTEACGDDWQDKIDSAFKSASDDDPCVAFSRSMQIAAMLLAARRIRLDVEGDKLGVSVQDWKLFLEYYLARILKLDKQPTMQELAQRSGLTYDMLRYRFTLIGKLLHGYLSSLEAGDVSDTTAAEIDEINHQVAMDHFPGLEELVAGCVPDPAGLTLRLEVELQAGHGPVLYRGQNDPLPVSVGRSDHCDLTLCDPHVSERHFVLSYQPSPAAWRLESTSSTNPTHVRSLVEGALREQVLEGGQSITLPAEARVTIVATQLRYDGPGSQSIQGSSSPARDH